MNSTSASAGASVIVAIFLRLSRTASTAVWATGTHARAKAVKVFVRAASIELSVLCGAVNESTITTNASASGYDLLSETGAGIATARAALDDAPRSHNNWLSGGGRSANISRIVSTAHLARSALSYSSSC